jgi:type VI secretion system secreted protein Hcp
MSIDAFLKFEGPEVEGESVVKGHDKELQVHSASFSAHNVGTRRTAKGAGAGKGDASDLNFSMDGDKTAVSLYDHCVQGTHFDKVTLFLRKVTGAGEEPMTFFEYQMKQAFISQFSMGAANGSETPSIQFAINCAEYEVTWTPQEDKGTPGGGITKKYNFAEQA